MEFMCVTPCLFRNTHIRENERVIVHKDEIVLCPTCGGKGCEKCRDSGRSRPPHHFVPNDKEAEAFQATIGKDMVSVTSSPPEMPPEVKEHEITRLREELNEMGKAVDPAWSLETLRNEVTAARKMKGAEPRPKFKPFKRKDFALKKAKELEIEDADGMSLGELNDAIKKVMEAPDAGQ